MAVSRKIPCFVHSSVVERSLLHVRSFYCLLVVFSVFQHMLLLRSCTNPCDLIQEYASCNVGPHQA